MSRVVSFAAVLACALALVASPAYSADHNRADREFAKRAQHRLNHLQCQAGPADGEVGRWTRSAIVRFQSRAGIAQNGRLDKPTRQRLYAGSAPRCDRRPVPARSGEGRRIVISQAQNWVWLVGPRGRIVEQGGMVDNPRVLRKGAHTVGSYCGRTARIRLNQTAGGTVWLDNFVRFAPCGIGFHRIPRYQSTGRQIHADWILGTNMSASHGCIRLSRQLSTKVWDFATLRTPVRVL